MQKNSKHSFLQGAIILTLATAVVKVIGALFQIPLANLLGGDGFGYFTSAYSIYNVLLIISTAGLPVAVSRMVSEADALGKQEEVRKIFRVSMITFLIIGGTGSAVMVLFAKQLANLMSNPNAWQAIMTLGPAVFFVAVMSAYRGYFQGRSNMIPTAVSQVIEALSKLFIGFGLAYYVVSAGLGYQLGSAGAIFGVTFGSALGALFLLLYASKAKRAILPESENTAKPRSSQRILKTLVKIAVPVTLGASVLSVVNLIDAALVMRRLQSSAGFAQDLANWTWGAYGMAQKLFTLPAAFIVPFSISIIPAITAALTRKRSHDVTRTVEASLRMTSLLAMPAGIGITVLSWPILNLLYFAKPDEVAAGAPLLRVLGVAVIFNCIVLITNAILQSFGKVNIPVFTMAVGGVVKITANWFLVGTPSINIQGAPVGTLLCYSVIAVMNLIFIARLVPQAPSIAKTFGRPLLAALLMGGAAWGVYTIAQIYLGARIAVVGAILAAVLCYLFFVIVLRAITRDDLLLLPKGEKIAKMLRIK